MNVLFIGLGNVCRTPMAESLLKKKFKEKGIEGIVDSAGFESFTINEAPDKRAVMVAKKFGIELNGKSRLFVKADFDKFDKIYVMDTLNYREVKDLERNKADEEKLDYLLNVLYPGENKTVPNPFMQGEHECLVVFDLLDKATTKIVENIKTS